MKRRILFTALMIVMAWQATAAAQTGTQILRHVQTIVIDPGHGGKNTGCMGYHGVYEKHATLQIAKRLEALLKSNTNATIFMTRTDDAFLPLRDRTRFANEKKADLFLSIHLNASPSQDARGIETFFLSTNSASDEIEALVKREQGELEIGSTATEAKEHAINKIVLDAELNAAHQLSEKLAWEIQKYMVRSTKGGNRGVKQAPFAVLKEATFPAVVIECGFFTHPGEGESLMSPDYQQDIAEGMLRGILSYDRLMAEAER